MNKTNKTTLTPRYFAVITHTGDNTRALVEFTGRGQLARKWLARSRRWVTSYLVDTLDGNLLSDVRMALPDDLKRFGFALPSSHYLA